MNEESLRDAMTASPRGEHLSESLWEALACGELEGEARTGALDHITTCDECDRIYRALVELHAGAVEFDPAAPLTGPIAAPATEKAAHGSPTGGNVVPHGAPTPHSEPGAPARSSARSGRRYAWLGLAAAALLAVVLIPRSEVTPPTDPNGPTPERPSFTTRTGGYSSTAEEPIALAPVGAFTTRPTTIRWTAADRVESYTVEIQDETGALLWTSAPTTETEIPWPALDFEAERLRWRVRARVEGGLRETRSEPAIVEFSDPAPLQAP